MFIYIYIQLVATNGTERKNRANSSTHFLDFVQRFQVPQFARRKSSLLCANVRFDQAAGVFIRRRFLPNGFFRIYIQGGYFNGFLCFLKTPFVNRCVLYEIVMLKTCPTRKRFKFHDDLVICNFYLFSLFASLPERRIFYFYFLSVSNALFGCFSTFKTCATCMSQTIIWRFIIRLK